MAWALHKVVCRNDRCTSSFISRVLPWLNLLPLKRLHLSAHKGIEGDAPFCRGDVNEIIGLKQLQILALQVTLPFLFLIAPAPMPIPFAQLTTSLKPPQGFRFIDKLPNGHPAASIPVTFHRSLHLPPLDLIRDTLRVLSLTGTSLSRMPVQIMRLHRLEILDLRDNKRLWILAPLEPFLALLPRLRLLDMRGTAPWRILETRPSQFKYSTASLIERVPWISTHPGLIEMIMGPGEASDGKSQVQVSVSLAAWTGSFTPPRWICDLSAICGPPGCGLSKSETEVQTMKRHLLSAKRYLETTRRPWHPVMDSVDDAKSVPEWRSTTAGGARHGPGPWMVLDDDIVGI